MSPNTNKIVIYEYQQQQKNGFFGDFGKIAKKNFQK